MKKFGAYNTTNSFNNLEYLKHLDMLPYGIDEVNPYVESFWKWWPELYNNLHTFRITGGEPLLSKDTFKILDYIIDSKSPNKKLKMCINTNLGVSQDIFNVFVEKLEKILDNELVDEFVIFTSADTWGKQAEYIRHGLDFNLFFERIDFLLDKFKTITIDIMSTYNALSVPNYKLLLHKVYELKERHHNPFRYWGSALLLDSSYLRWPEHQTVKILPQEWYSKIDEQAKLVDFYEQTRTGVKDGYGFTDIEINKIKRIKDWYISDEGSENLERNRHDFHLFITEHDKRRGTDFVKTFPELEDFFNKCKK